MDYKAQMRQIKKEFRNERKEIKDNMKAERQAVKDKYGKPKMTDEEEKEFLVQKIFKIQLKYYQKFNEAPKDLLAEHQKNGTLQDLLSKKRDSSSEKH